MSCYIRVEAVNLDNLIGDTQTLHVIRGGSALITDAIGEVASHFKDEMRLIFSDASSGVYETTRAGMDEKAAEALCSGVLDHLRGNIYRHATFVACFVLVDGASAGSFGAVCEELLAKNRWQQMQQLSLSLCDVFGGGGGKPVVFCELDTLRPARENWHSSYGVKKVCGACIDRISLGRDTKKKFYERELGAGVGLKNGFAQSFEDISRIDPSVLGVRGISPRLADKIALIYIDGNSVGKLMRGLDGTDKVVRASDDYKNYRRKFLRQLIVEHVEAGEDSLWTGMNESGRYNRMELLMWGGDEMTLVVPAWKGWETLALFYQLSKDWKLENRPITHAAGLVFCSHKSHIHHQVGLAHSLAGEVKVCASPGNRFACQVVDGFDYVDADLEAARRPLCGEGGESMLLSGGAMEGAAEGFAKMREMVSRAQVYDLVEALAADDEAAKKESRRLLSVLKQHADSVGLIECLGKGCTFWLHLRELWNFIPMALSLSAPVQDSEGAAK